MTPYRIRGITIKDRSMPLNELIASILPSRFYQKRHPNNRE
jgi:hypothetical protein